MLEATTRSAAQFWQPVCLCYAIDYHQLLLGMTRSCLLSRPFGCTRRFVVMNVTRNMKAKLVDCGTCACTAVWSGCLRATLQESHLRVQQKDFTNYASSCSTHLAVLIWVAITFMHWRIWHVDLLSRTGCALSVTIQPMLPSWYCIQNAMTDSPQHMMSCKILAEPS